MASASNMIFLVITTGPKLAFDGSGAGPHAGFTQSICSIDHAERAYQTYQHFLDHPGPAIIGAMPRVLRASPQLMNSFIVNTDLRKRKLRHKVPMTYVTSEPYIGHLGLGGVGDSKSMLESGIPQ